MTRKTKIITLSILGAVAALGVFGCCAGWFDPLFGPGSGHVGGRRWSGRSGPIWFGGGSHSSGGGASHGTGSTGRGGFGATGSRGGGIGA